MSAGTFSIVAVDLEQRQWGVAVASKFLAVGALCAWAEAEVGAVATQSWIRAAYGPEGLGLLEGGASATDALERLVAADDGREQRQVGMVDAGGRTAVHTGSGCIDWAGDRTGPGFAVQGNMLVSAATVDAVADTFEAAASDSLARRLLVALAAGQAAGGDRRGQQAAALKVVGRGAGYGGADVVVDLRVDDHPEPIAELERLYDQHQLYFGSTPAELWVPVDGELAAELRRRLGRLGHASGELVSDLEEWAGVENLEERVKGADRIDPVVLAALRATGERRQEG